MIEADINCGQCHYDLRGLSEQGRCPECGWAIGLTLERIRSAARRHEISTDHSDPAARRAWARGIALSLTSPVALVAGMFVLGVREEADSTRRVAASVLILAGWVAAAVGYFLLGRKDRYVDWSVHSAVSGILRFAALIYALIPVWRLIATPVAAVAGISIPLTWYGVQLRVIRLANRTGLPNVGTQLMIAFILLALPGLFLFVIGPAMACEPEPRGVVAILAEVPSPVALSPAGIAFVIHDVPHFTSGEAIVIFLAAAFILWQAANLLTLYWYLSRPGLSETPTA